MTEQSPSLRRIADISLIRALRLKGAPVSPPLDGADCSSLRPNSPDGLAETPLPKGGAVVGVPGNGFASAGLRRFADPGASSYELVRVGKGGWVEIAIPTDASEVPWQLVVDGAVRICPR